ncbi:MAG TPA: protease inhibitor I42 family protein [Gaiellaceae bacterium]
MRKRVVAFVLALAAAGVAAAGASPSATPVGPLPPGPVTTLAPAVGKSFAVTLPRPASAGRNWRIARTFDSAVVREVSEATTKAGSVRVTFRAVGVGTTRVVFALTLGERSHAYAARTYRVVVARRSTDSSSCPRNLLPLTANPIGPSVTAALVGDATKNRPQAVGAMVASHDTQRGAQVKAQCGTKVWQRTVVVYVTDRALLPSQSLSQRVVFVGRTPAGYRVWQRAH